MMVCVLAPLLLILLQTESLASQSSAEEGPASPCPPQWLPLGQRCFAFYPVWSSWSAAHSLCSQAGGSLASLHTPEERQFVRQLNRPVWLGAYQVQQNGSWFWSDNSPFRINSWTSRRRGGTPEGGLCLEMDPKSGWLQGAPCGELRFYICSTTAGAAVFPSSRKHVKPGLAPGASLFDVAWSYSHSLVEEILRSSSFIGELRSGHLTERCYNSFIQQEALYLHRVSGTLEALLGRLHEADRVEAPLLLLRDTFRHYSTNQSLPPTLLPPWMQSSLQSFHSVVLEEPVYWLVALSARAGLQSLLAGEMRLLEVGRRPRLASGSAVDPFYREWGARSMEEVAWTHRFRWVMKEHQNKMDVFKAINVFRVHMINQRNFYKAIDSDCDG